MAEASTEWVWMPHPTEFMLPVKFATRSKTAGAADAQTLFGVGESGQEYKCTVKDAQSYPPVHPSSMRGLENMIELEELTEAVILHTLRQRYRQDKIYTYISSILLAINPYKLLPFYGKDAMKSVRDRDLTAAKIAAGMSVPKEPFMVTGPHSYVLASDVHKQLISTGSNQSVIISGESGAGKTETTKFALQYFSFVSGMEGDSTSIARKLIEANPIIESFGNAMTVRNDNSSRFGKWVEVLFDSQHRIAGGYLSHYLLEKSRVVSQSLGERNYHVFYQFCAANQAQNPHPLVQKYKMGPAGSYAYLSSGKQLAIDGVSDLETFNRTMEAFATLRISNDEVTHLFDALAVVLHIGNIPLKPENGNEDVASIDPAHPELVAAASILGVTPVALERSLVTWVQAFSKRSIIRVPFSVKQALAGRDAFAKHLYSRVFDWMMSIINRNIEPSKYIFGIIGVLDIFGFEIFETNRFEQFLINFANEKLQQHFNHRVFELEQEEYKIEGLPIEYVKFQDNRECINLMEKQGTGILSMLDDELKLPKGSDLNFLGRIHTAFQKHPYYVKPRMNNPVFSVKHYAGDVAYEVSGFLEKNKDRMHDGLPTAISVSEKAFFAQLFHAAEDDKTSQKANRTLGMEFKSQLWALMKKLESTNPHFVRCLKPNAVKKPDNFDSMLVLRQLRYAGIEAVIRVRQQGFPVRHLHADFFRRFKVLSQKVLLFPPQFKDEAPNVRDGRMVDTLMKELSVPAATYAIGKTKVFLTHERYMAMEKARDVAVKRAVLVMQSYWRARQTRMKLKAMKQSNKILKELIASVEHKTISLQAIISPEFLGKLTEAINKAVSLGVPVRMPSVTAAQSFQKTLAPKVKARQVLIDAVQSNSMDEATYNEAIAAALAVSEDLKELGEFRAVIEAKTTIVERRDHERIRKQREAIEQAERERMAQERAAQLAAEKVRFEEEQRKKREEFEREQKRLAEEREQDRVRQHQLALEKARKEDIQKEVDKARDEERKKLEEEKTRFFAEQQRLQAAFELEQSRMKSTFEEEQNRLKELQAQEAAAKLAKEQELERVKLELRRVEEGKMQSDKQVELERLEKLREEERRAREREEQIIKEEEEQKRFQHELQTKDDTHKKAKAESDVVRFLALNNLNQIKRKLEALEGENRDLKAQVKAANEQLVKQMEQYDNYTSKVSIMEAEYVKRVEELTMALVASTQAMDARRVDDEKKREEDLQSRPAVEVLQDIKRELEFKEEELGKALEEERFSHGSQTDGLQKRIMDLTNEINHISNRHQDQLTKMQKESDQREAAALKVGAANARPAEPNGPAWNCSACTFLNAGTKVTCDMCGSGKPAPTLAALVAAENWHKRVKEDEAVARRIQQEEIEERRKRVADIQKRIQDNDAKLKEDESKENRLFTCVRCEVIVGVPYNVTSFTCPSCHAPYKFERRDKKPVDPAAANANAAAAAGSAKAEAGAVVQVAQQSPPQRNGGVAAAAAAKPAAAPAKNAVAIHPAPGGAGAGAGGGFMGRWWQKNKKGADGEDLIGPDPAVEAEVAANVAHAGGGGGGPAADAGEVDEEPADARKLEKVESKGVLSNASSAASSPAVSPAPPGAGQRKSLKGNDAHAPMAPGGASGVVSPPIKGGRVGLMASGGAVAGGEEAWTCSNCTFENAGSSAKCEVCRTSKAGAAAAAGAGAGAGGRDAVPALDRMTKLYRNICHPEGHPFVKYGRQGKPHIRVIVVSDKDGSISWESKEKMPVSSVTRVEVGCTTEVFLKNKANKDANPSLCFSLVTQDRTLDLQAKTERQRDDWVEFMRHMISEGSVMGDKHAQ